MKWIVTLLALAVFLTSANSTYLAVATVFPSIVDLPAETRAVTPSWSMIVTYMIGKEILTIFLAGMATYLAWKK